MNLYLYNTLTKKKELFEPKKKGVVTMYNCGPTVYNFAHIGNLRSYVFADILRRILLQNGYKVKQVINITDVGHLVSDGDEGEDKMLVGARRENKSAQEIATYYTEAFLKDIQSLNVETKDVHFPKASEHIKEQIELIQKLEKKGVTYQISDGIYFDTSKFPAYGKLGNINFEGLEEGARVAINKEKKNATDFALWKFSPKDGTRREQEWDSPWEIGFPGWHIECSAMSMKYLGETIDIHTGGIDHIPTHHNNEIAQSESATAKLFVRFWLHHAHLVTHGEKISKSKGNVFYLKDVVEKGISALSFRYWLLQASYETQMNFTWESLQGSDVALRKLLTFFNSLGEEIGKVDEGYLQKFMECVNDNLNTPKALAVLWELVKNGKILAKNKKATLLKFDLILGLAIENSAETLKKIEDATQIPEGVKKLANEREQFRKQKEWQKADEVREKIEKLGFTILDDTSGPKIRKIQ